MATGGQRRVTWRTVRAIAAAPPVSRYSSAIRRERLARDRVEARQDCLINSAKSSERGEVWTYRPTRNRGKSRKHHSDQERGPAAS
jgi:hypothetical protein